MITNKLTFDPPTRLPELIQNLIRSSYGHSTPSLKISCKSVQPFSRNVADKETKKQRNKERKKSPENNKKCDHKPFAEKKTVLTRRRISGENVVISRRRKRNLKGNNNCAPDARVVCAFVIYESPPCNLVTRFRCAYR